MGVGLRAAGPAPVTRYVVLAAVVATLVVDTYTVSLMHALSWLFGVITGVVLCCIWRDQ